MDFLPLNLPNIATTRPMVIAGPCSAETEEQTLATARQLAQIGVRIMRAGLWKPRTKPGGFEGVGSKGLEWLRRAKAETGLYIATEVATAQHVHQAIEGEIDLLWLGARTTSNPFAVQEIADALRGTDIPVLVKNPISPDIDLWIGAIERIYGAGIRRIAAVHRGFQSTDESLYRNQPLWHIPIELHRRLPNLPLFCDPSHMGGKRQFIATLSQQAMDLQFDGLMIESHCAPDTAWSDSEQQITPRELQTILQNLIIRNTAQPTAQLDELRRQIDTIDSELLETIAKRMRVSAAIGAYKKANGIAALQTGRYNEVLARRIADGQKLGLSPELTHALMEAIHAESVRIQIDEMNE
jgi:chorismate mutase